MTTAISGNHLQAAQAGKEPFWIPVGEEDLQATAQANPDKTLNWLGLLERKETENEFLRESGDLS